MARFTAVPFPLGTPVYHRSRWSYQYLDGVIPPVDVRDPAFAEVAAFLEPTHHTITDSLRFQQVTYDEACAILQYWVRSPLLYHILEYVDPWILSRIAASRAIVPAGTNQFTIYPCPDCSCGIRAIGHSNWWTLQCTGCTRSERLLRGRLAEDITEGGEFSPLEMQCALEPGQTPIETSASCRLRDYPNWRKHASFLITLLAFLGPALRLRVEEPICPSCQISNMSVLDPKMCPLCRFNVDPRNGRVAIGFDQLRKVDTEEIPKALAGYKRRLQHKGKRQLAIASKSCPCLPPQPDAQDTARRRSPPRQRRRY